MFEAQKVKPKILPFKCPNCNGYGTVGYDKRKCHSCKGTGVVHVPQEEDISNDPNKKYG